MLSPREIKDRSLHFTRHRLWRMEPQNTWAHRGIMFLRSLVMIWRHFNHDNCFLRAGALAYTTIFALVPVLALLIAMLGAFAPFREYESRIVDFVLNQLLPPVKDSQNPQATQDVALRIKNFLLEKQEALREASTAIGAVGVGVLVLSIISLMTSIEKAFNTIWHVDKPRTLVNRVIYYWSLTIVPILVVISLAFAASLTSSSAVQWLKTLPVISFLVTHETTTLVVGAGTPLLFMWIAFTALYIYLPNTPVRLKSAAIGGTVGAVLFELAKWASFVFSSRFIRYKALYGAFAALPIFLVWIYFVWVIVLLGAEVAYAHQNLGEYSQLERMPRVSHSERERIAIRILAWICRRFHVGEPALHPSEISRRFDVPGPLVFELCRAMSACGILTEVRDGEERYQPNRDLSMITVKDVVDCLRRGAGEYRSEPQPDERFVLELFARGESVADEVFASTTFAEIAEKMAQQG